MSLAQMVGLLKKYRHITSKTRLPTMGKIRKDTNFPHQMLTRSMVFVTRIRVSGDLVAKESVFSTLNEGSSMLFVIMVVLLVLLPYYELLPWSKGHNVYPLTMVFMLSLKFGIAVRVYQSGFIPRNLQHPCPWLFFPFCNIHRWLWPDMELSAWPIPACLRGLF